MVEMLRRFGLHFRIFDEMRLEDDIHEVDDWSQDSGRLPRRSAPRNDGEEVRAPPPPELEWAGGGAES